MTNKKTVYIPNIGIAEVSDYKPTPEVEKIFTDMENKQWTLIKIYVILNMQGNFYNLQ